MVYLFLYPNGHGSKSQTPSKHPNPHYNRLKWVVNSPTPKWDPKTVLTTTANWVVPDKASSHHRFLAPCSGPLRSPPWPTSQPACARPGPIFRGGGGGSI